jgi:hypothetical protein
MLVTILANQIALFQQRDLPARTHVTKFKSAAFPLRILKMLQVLIKYIQR